MCANRQPLVFQCNPLPASVLRADTLSLFRGRLESLLQSGPSLPRDCTRCPELLSTPLHFFVFTFIFYSQCLLLTWHIPWSVSGQKMSLLFSYTVPVHTFVYVLCTLLDNSRGEQTTKFTQLNELYHKAIFHFSLHLPFSPTTLLQIINRVFWFSLKDLEIMKSIVFS